MKKKISTIDRDFATKPQKTFLNMIAPSVIKFFTDYFICGNTFRCVWALREYPTSTSEQAILRYLGEKDGVTLSAFNTRPLLPPSKTDHECNERSKMRSSSIRSSKTEKVFHLLYVSPIFYFLITKRIIRTNEYFKHRIPKFQVCAQSTCSLARKYVVP